MNFVVPLQLGVRDVAFPTLNSVSFWLTATGALLVNISLVVGEFARTGWLPFPPLSELTYSPGVGVDYYLWALQISGVGTLMTGVNFVTTILKIHAPGMTYMRMPIFSWTALASNLLDRRRLSGSHRDARDADPRPLPRLPLLHQRGRRQHDDVHEPHLGVGPSRRFTSSSCRRSACSPKWSRPSRASRCSATARWCSPPWRSASSPSWCGCIISSPWAPAPTSTRCSASPSMIIAVPTGVKVYNWLFTMYGGRIVFATPMLWSIGFMVTFVIGGLTGVLLAVPPADFVLHNSLFLVAHFHNVIIGGVVFGDVRRLHLLVPEGVRLPPARGLGQGRVLVLVRRLLRRVRAALCRGSHGHDPAHAALRRTGMAALASGRGGRRAGHPGRHRLPGRCNSSSASAIANSCATRPAIPGRAARSNGRRPRRRRPSISPCCLRSRASTTIGA